MQIFGLVVDNQPASGSMMFYDHGTVPKDDVYLVFCTSY